GHTDGVDLARPAHTDQTLQLAQAGSDCFGASEVRLATNSVRQRRNLHSFFLTQGCSRRQLRQMTGWVLHEHSESRIGTWNAIAGGRAARELAAWVPKGTSTRPHRHVHAGQS